jgi:hypothetical protein
MRPKGQFRKKLNGFFGRGLTGGQPKQLYFFQTTFLSFKMPSYNMPSYNINLWASYLEIPDYEEDTTCDEWFNKIIDHAGECARRDQDHMIRLHKMVATIDEDACPFVEVRFPMVLSLNQNENVWRTVNVANFTCRQFLEAMFNLYKNNRSDLGDHIHFDGVKHGVALIVREWH